MHTYIRQLLAYNVLDGSTLGLRVTIAGLSLLRDLRETIMDKLLSWYIGFSVQLNEFV